MQNVHLITVQQKNQNRTVGILRLHVRTRRCTDFEEHAFKTHNIVIIGILTRHCMYKHDTCTHSTVL